MPSRPVSFVYRQIDAACCAPDGAARLPGPQLRLTPDEAEQLAALGKALAHPVRVQIVELLSRVGGLLCVCEIEAQFDLSQPTISHHLRILREAGLVRAESRAQWSYYTLLPEALAPLQALMATVKGADTMAR